MSDANADAIGHTPGPWEVDTWRGQLGTADGIHCAVWKTARTQLPLLICTTGLVGTEESAENALLIAAAPDLLAALRQADRAITLATMSLEQGQTINGHIAANGPTIGDVLLRTRCAISKAIAKTEPA